MNNLQWNGTTQTYSIAGKCLPDSAADKLGFDWILEAIGFMLKDKSPGPRLFLACCDGAYVVAVQPNSGVLYCHTIASYTKRVDALVAYRTYRKDLTARYERGRGRPPTK